ncbi:retrovirus-related pol polyprotein from transposon TNT 1-94 [Tanacetum coccineum]
MSNFSQSTYLQNLNPRMLFFMLSWNAGSNRSSVSMLARGNSRSVGKSRINEMHCSRIHPQKVDACPNACEMWKAIERLKQGESINVQDLETNLYWEFGKFTSRDGESLESYYSRFYKMMNELVRNQCNVTNHQVNVQFLLQLQPEWQRFVTLVKQSQELKTVSYHKLYDILKQHQNEVNEIRTKRLARTANPLALVAQQQPVYHPTQNTQYSSTRSQQSTRNRDEEMSKEKEIDKLMALISLSFKKIYKPTNNNLRTSSNTSRANQDNSPRTNRGTGYDNQRAINVAGLGNGMSEPKRSKDALSTKKKCYGVKEEAGFQLNENKLIGKDDTDDVVTPLSLSDSSDLCYDRAQMHVQDETDALDQEHNQLLMFKDLKKFQAELDKYKDVNYASKVEIDCAKAKGDLMSYKIDFEKSSNAYTQQINDLNQTISDMKKELCAHQETISIMSQAKEAQIKLYKTREDKELDKVIALENKVKVLNDIVYKTGQSVQTMNMLNRNCKTSFAKPEFLKKAQRANPRLYDIGCYNDNLALMLAPDSDETIRLDKERRSKLSDLIRPFDYAQLNNLYDWFVPQREKSAEQHHFPKTSKMCHTSSNKEFSKESFRKQSTLLEKRMDESIPWDQKCKSSKELFKIKKSVDTIFDGVERCKQTIAKRTYFEEMVADLKYVNSLEDECVLNDNHDLCVLHYINGVNSRTRQPMAVPVRTTKPKHNVNQSVATSIGGILSIHHLDTKWKPKFKRNDVNQNLVEIILFIVDSGCSKHMTGNLKLLTNFVEKFLGTVKFGNDQICNHILGYGDLGNDLLKGSRGTDLYSITLQDSTTPNPICLMAKATSSQAWLWHQRFYGKKYGLVIVETTSRFTWTHFLRSKTKHLELLIDSHTCPKRTSCSSEQQCENDKGTEFLNKTLLAYFAKEGIRHETSTARTPEQNSVVKRWNCTLVEAARTMLSARLKFLFLWLKQLQQMFYSKNRSLVFPRHEKNLIISSMPETSVQVLSFFVTRNASNGVNQQVLTPVHNVQQRCSVNLTLGTSPVVSKSSAVHAADNPDNVNT